MNSNTIEILTENINTNTRTNIKTNASINTANTTNKTSNKCGIECRRCSNTDWCQCRIRLVNIIFWWPYNSMKNTLSSLLLLLLLSYQCTKHYFFNDIDKYSIQHCTVINANCNRNRIISRRPDNYFYYSPFRWLYIIIILPLLLLVFLVLLCPLQQHYTVLALKWTLVKDFDFLDNSYLMRWHPGRHTHLQLLNDTSMPTYHHQTPSTNIDALSSDTGTSKIARPIRFVVLAPYGSNEQYSLEKIMPAIVAAVKSIEEEARLNKHKYLGWEHGAEIDFVDTQCSSAIGPLAAFHYYIKGKVDVFLGPVCPYVLAPVARYTSYWDIPHITSSGQVSMFDDKNSTFRILTRMNGSFSRMGQFFNQILQRFDWKTVFFLYTDHNDRSKGHSLCYFSLASVFMSMGPKAVELKRSFDEEQDSAFEEYLKDASMKSRIIIMCAKKETVRKIMITAYKLKMIQTGEYVFINVELTTGLDVHPRPWQRDDDSEQNNTIAREAYTALIRVTPKMPHTADIKSFLDSVQKVAKEEFFLNYEKDEMSTYVTAFHEAVLVYAVGLNDTLAEGHSAINGTMITKKIWNRTFNGIAGKVSVDSNGDRLVDYTLFDMNPETGDFEAVMIFDSLMQQFFEVAGKKIHWANDRIGPPPDIPPCGFDGEKCLAEAEFRSQLVLIITAVVLSLLLLFLFVVFILVYRHYRLEAELASMTWKIRCEDIITTSTEMMYMQRFGSRMSLARTSISSDTMPLVNGGKICSQKTIPRTAVYRGVFVALKPIEKQRIELTRSLLIELKNMKNLQHNHIVTFIGACIDQPNVSFLVTEYCPKGSLQDILENDEIKLDWMFRYSLMHDIVKGMSYLHASEMHVHGNLKSSNCMVDSRFVLKVADFGLHSLRQSDYNCNNRSPILPHNIDETHYAYWRKKLWTAPELLRLWFKSFECNGNKQIQQLHTQFLHGTQKGDVYSFAIILHEIILRQGVFYLGEENIQSPREIVYKLAQSQESPLRPLLEEQMADEKVLQMVRRCWHEDPNERPDFVTLQSIIRRINKENESSNILDNLLKRMEQYANNLESLVQERTADYLEEKRKAEDLLYQLLPKSVASQLISGKSVRAEAYDSVTIYFSDIVGFTNISAQSTPMQVVNLLNDLYTCFDSILENFDVYKVETIGDAYMVVSGVPVRNGEKHGPEIARMSLALLNAVGSFRIRHRPGEQLKLRIGIHTGPCAAGVVGLKMPRYCLFGDTVNTASRMESTGQALRIHVSSNTKALLDKFKEFDLNLRGEIDVKGKGKMTTYWLIGMKKQNQRFNNFGTEMSNEFKIDINEEYLTETNSQPNNNSSNISFEEDTSMVQTSVQTN